MVGLTGEELREACEAVGWLWDDDIVVSPDPYGLPGAAAFEGEFSEEPRFPSWDASHWNADAIALLEAWKEQHQGNIRLVEINLENDAFVILREISEQGEKERDWRSWSCATLKEAAVRAVLSWKRAKKWAS